LGGFFGSWLTWKILKTEIYAYVKASRLDQATIQGLILEVGDLTKKLGRVYEGWKPE
jgi:hypothetical protein